MEIVCLACGKVHPGWLEGGLDCISCPHCDGELFDIVDNDETTADDYDWEDDTDDRGWLTYGERMEQQRGY